MLDNCSQGCFVKASLMKTLQIRGEGLRVCSQLGLNQEWISLPKTYTKNGLPVDSWEVATAQKLKKRRHLSSKTIETSTLNC